MGNNFLYGQSGGPTSVINASFSGMIKRAYEAGTGKVYGMLNGIEGFLQGKYMDMYDFYRSDEFELLKHTPAAFLGTCRFKLPGSIEDDIFKKIFQKFEELDIGFVFYNGGNDSMDTTDKLSRYAAKVGSDIKVIGIPKTIDNDLALTDHTPGYGSAAKYVASSIREVALDSNVYNKPAVTIMEIMGRNAGWLTAAAALARKFDGDNPCLIYLPEVPFDPDAFIDALNKKLKQNKTAVVAISEGIALANGKFVCEDDSTTTDSFGHKSLRGTCKVLENLVQNKLNIKPRGIEFSLLQRAAAKNASLTDISEAVHAGASAVDAALRGETGKMVAFERISDNPYKMECKLVPANEVCNAEKKVPLEWYDTENADIKDAFIQYALPLITGEPDIEYENGLPKFCYRR